jgi:hypothetical protein
MAKVIQASVRGMNSRKRVAELRTKQVKGESTENGANTDKNNMDANDYDEDEEENMASVANEEEERRLTKLAVKHEEKIILGVGPSTPRVSTPTGGRRTVGALNLASPSPAKSPLLAAASPVLPPTQLAANKSPLLAGSPSVAPTETGSSSSSGGGTGSAADSTAGKFGVHIGAVHVDSSEGRKEDHEKAEEEEEKTLWPGESPDFQEPHEYDPDWPDLDTNDEQAVQNWILIHKRLLVRLLCHFSFFFFFSFSFPFPSSALIRLNSMAISPPL